MSLKNKEKMHNHHHHHDHHHSATDNLKLALMINLSFAIIELIGGYYTDSMAVIADALHDFGDSLTLAGALYFEMLARRTPDRVYSYGYRRFSLLSAAITAVVLIVGSMFVVMESIPRFANPVQPHTGGMALMAILGISVNGYAAWRTSRGKTHNERMISWHMLEDLFGWILILIGSGMMQFLDAPIIDPALSIGFSAFILIGVGRNLRRTAQLFLQSVPQDLDRANLIRDLESVEGVEEIHDLHVWSLDGDSHVISFHATTAPDLKSETLAKIKSQLRDTLALHGKFHSTIEIEAHIESCSERDCTPR